MLTDWNKRNGNYNWLVVNWGLPVLPYWLAQYNRFFLKILGSQLWPPLAVGSKWLILGNACSDTYKPKNMFGARAIVSPGITMSNKLFSKEDTYNIESLLGEMDGIQVK